MSPIDKDLINFKMLNYNEREWLNKYHEKVYYTLKKAMNKNEVLELQHACSAI